MFDDLFAEILEKEQVEAFVRKLSKLDNGRRVALWTLQKIRFSKQNNRKEIYEKGRHLFLGEYKQAEEQWNQKEKEPSYETDLVKEFQFKLEPEKGRYSLDVFRFFLDNKHELMPQITEKEKSRIKELIVGSVFSKFDPGEYSLEITDTGSGYRSYKTHSWISIFGQCIRIASELKLDITRYRKRIVNYIPFAYSEELEALFSLVRNIRPDEMSGLLSVYKEKKSDLWRFMPENFVSASERYIIKESVPILREFVRMDEFPVYERVRALKTCEFLGPDAAFLKDTFRKYEKDKELSRLAEEANELLIDIYQDKAAISWRLNKLKTREIQQEHEFYEKEFPASLMRLKDPKYQVYFLDLLRWSFSVRKKEGHGPYIEYLWDVVCSFFENLKGQRSYAPLRLLESVVEEYSTDEGINWFKYRLQRLKRSYMFFIGKPSGVVECIRKYNMLKRRQYFQITTPHSLREKIKEVIDEDLRRWVEGEGAYSFIVGNKIRESRRQDYENLIQKTVKTQLAYALLNRGFKGTDIIREPQLLDGKRVDFLIFYGFIGPILIEVKLSEHRDLDSRKNFEHQKSYKNLVRYMEGFNAHYGIFLVVDNKVRSPEAEKWESHLARIRNAYNKIKNVEVLGLTCIQI